MFLRSLFNHIELNKPELESNFEKRMPLQFHITFVNPIGKKISKREKILLNVNSGVGKDHGCGCSW
ncbi:hypothetical protein NC653_032548 [Populus alba x Populus x berolinensis]|uniref:Uncharacterized protein n=1 Tax=Populus alba x Populus x berolinensis TaxID=444605 RepID=A0AAD6LRK7_9ROSI|nr:hypothetical protein NC653_032548 [Populus alba x Populus x berolinensis]